MNLIAIIVTLITYGHFVNTQNPPIIETKYGKIQGTSDDYAFLYHGIPYAMPPVDELRWKPPVAIQPWSPQVLNATAFRPECPQPGKGTYAEDCLYLNVYATKKINPTGGVKKAVMVFIHGGGFEVGNPDVFGGAIASIGDVIFVSLAYRLGALGFLATLSSSEQIAGNFGILDQRLALQWVYENIEAFGGDAERITIFGQSAGARSVATHVLSVDSQPYYTNAIIQSGPLAWSYKTYDEANSQYVGFAGALNCPVDDLYCLRSKTVSEIVNAEHKPQKTKGTLKSLSMSEWWCPVIDGKIIKGQILEIEKWLSSDFTFKSFIIGSLPEEWISAVYSTWPNYLSIDDYISQINTTFGNYASRVLSLYPPSNNGSTARRNTLSHLLTAWSLSCTVRNYTEKYMSVQNSRTHYRYVFDYPVDFSGYLSHYCTNHTCHSGDIPYTFDYPDYKFKPDGHAIALEHIAYWTNFAKYGSPNNGTFVSDSLLNWPSYDRITRNYLRFKAQPNEIENNYLTEECDFFDSIGYYYN